MAKKTTKTNKSVDTTATAETPKTVLPAVPLFTVDWFEKPILLPELSKAGDNQRYLQGIVVHDVLGGFSVLRRVDDSAKSKGEETMELRTWEGCFVRNLHKVPNNKFDTDFGMLFLQEVFDTFLIPDSTEFCKFVKQPTAGSLYHVERWVEMLPPIVAEKIKCFLVLCEIEK